MEPLFKWILGRGRSGLWKIAAATAIGALIPLPLAGTKDVQEFGIGSAVLSGGALGFVASVLLVGRDALRRRGRVKSGEPADRAEDEDEGKHQKLLIGCTLVWGGVLVLLMLIWVAREVFRRL